MELKPKITISPSVACADFRHLEKDIRTLEECKVDFLHIDIMDGTFVPNFALDFSLMKMLREMTSIPLECHLMVVNPERYIEKTAEAGAHFITIHAESTFNVQRALVTIRELGVKSGIALNPATPVNVLEHILDDLDMVVVMTVNPGFAGQKMIPSMLEKVTRVRKLIDDRGLNNIIIQVDGNVSLENIPLMVKAGATMLVGGTSSVFRKGHSIIESVEAIRTLIKKHT